MFSCGEDRGSIALVGGADGVLVVEEQQFGLVGIPRYRIEPDNIRIGQVIGQKGGHQTHVRLSDESSHYILFEGSNGELTEQPGLTYAGAAILPISSEDTPRLQFSCEATELNRGVVEAVRSWEIERGRPEPQAEEPGSPFDGWF